jgi:hypothetical protein
VLLFALALVGSHYGFYSLVHSSESLSYLPLAALLVLAARAQPLSVAGALGLGLLAYLLVLIRSQLALYCAPIYLWALWPALLDLKERARRAASFARFACAGLPPVAALIQGKALYALMMGPGKSSPYVFGDGEFASFSLRGAELRAVLVHAWHGLFTYHPVYALGLGCLIALFAHLRTVRGRLALAALLAAMAAHVLVHAAWYCWWLGTGTFGMRGLSVWCILLFPALGWALGQRRGALLYLPIALCCAWSFLLLVQTVEPSVYVQHYTWRALLDSLAVTARAHYSDALALALLAAAVAWMGREGQARGVRASWAGSACAFTLYACYALDVNAGPRGPFSEFVRGREGWLHVLLAVLIAASCSGAGSWRLDLSRLRMPVVGRGFLVAGLVLFLLSNALFARRLAQFAEQRAPYDPARFRYCSSVQVEEVVATYHEYLRVPAFQAKKAQLKRYVDALDVRSCR